MNRRKIISLTLTITELACHFSLLVVSAKLNSEMLLLSNLDTKGSAETLEDSLISEKIFEYI